MHNMLIIEDDAHKLLSIKKYISEEMPTYRFDIARSVSSAFRCLENYLYDIAIVDMSLPSFDEDYDSFGNKPINFGGEEIIDYIDRLSLTTKVIIFTQYPGFKSNSGDISIDDISDQFLEDYPEIYLGTVHYNIASDAWKKALNNIISRIIYD